MPTRSKGSVKKKTRRPTDKNSRAAGFRELRQRRRALRPFGLHMLRWYRTHSSPAIDPPFRKIWRLVPAVLYVVHQARLAEGLTPAATLVSAWIVAYFRILVATPPASATVAFRRADRRLSRVLALLKGVYSDAVEFAPGMHSPIRPLIRDVIRYQRAIRVLSPSAEQRRRRSARFIVGSESVLCYVLRRIYIESGGTSVADADVRVATLLNKAFQTSVHVSRKPGGKTKMPRTEAPAIRMRVGRLKHHAEKVAAARWDGLLYKILDLPIPSDSLARREGR